MGEATEHAPVLPGRTRRTVSPALHGCTLEVKKGELVAVVGGVGSGKSRSGVDISFFYMAFRLA